MEIKIKFDLFNDILNYLVEKKKDFDEFQFQVNQNYEKIKLALDDLNSLIILLLIDDKFI